MLHISATLGNILLLLVLMRFRGWRTWPWIFWAQTVSIALMAAHNWQMNHDWTGYVRWWNSFDIANLVIEMLYLVDLRKRPLGFSVFAALGIFTCLEYAVAEAGFGPVARQMLLVRCWTDMAAVYLLLWIIIRSGGTAHAAQTL